ncbi:MurR/RpiR family transcriptional regulator [Shinella zoogloeoides]|uniref:MurR/RpiR family transcriptional regulator n=1 Tax=Shinella zoogloeoides TaxID=352475 RepID=UPI000E65E1E0|nr:MurR/RpiR family transcriptional regulator [Shinella zoogloeoides]
MEQPKDMAALKLQIANRAVRLPAQCERIARIVFQRPEIVAFGTARSIAQTFTVSPSTIMRLIRALGFARFRDFRALFQDHLRSASAAGQRMEASTLDRVRAVP